jgi:flavin reductase (DIM6/NTAB) family NADH-FMN oxidoreductase RutF
MSSSSSLQLQTLMRSLMRRVAQPVSVLTVKPSLTSSTPDRLPSLPPPPEGSTTHSILGATLSSLSSVSLQPFPTISFALRIPSRAADALGFPPNRKEKGKGNEFEVDLLCEHQEKEAIIFAGDKIEKVSMGNDMIEQTFRTMRRGSLGWLKCRVVQRIPIVELKEEETVEFDPEKGTEAWGTSHLFLARVLEVHENKPFAQHLSERPLVYWKHQFTGVKVPK